MFKGCTGLTAAPSLTAASRAVDSCYRNMFEGCTGLTSTPDLPADQNPVAWCCDSMFIGCTGLVKAVLPATGSLGYTTFGSMFYGCTNLSSVECHFSSWGEGTTNWLSGVASNGEFKCSSALGTNETIARGVSRCPENWTVVNV